MIFSKQCNCLAEKVKLSIGLKLNLASRVSETQILSAIKRQNTLGLMPQTRLTSQAKHFAFVFIFSHDSEFVTRNNRSFLLSSQNIIFFRRRIPRYVMFYTCTEQILDRISHKDG